MLIQKRLVISFAVFVITILTGTLGFKFMGGEKWTFVDALYMTVISLTTVGYEETHKLTNDSLRIFTLFLILAGLGTVTYTVSTITAYLVEGDLKDTLRRKRMMKEIKALKDHIIVCGGGMTGIHIIEELIETRSKFVLIEMDEERIKKIIHSVKEFPYVVGDATEDEMLINAGIKSAKGIIPALTDDKDNLFITITARALNPDMRIIAKTVDEKSRPKLIQAGADVVISPQLIGGLRLTSEMIRPSVTVFLDYMMRAKDRVVRIEEVSPTKKSELCGKTVLDAAIRRKTGVTLLAIRRNDKFRYNPKPDETVNAGDTLIIYGDSDEIQKLRELC